MRLSKLHFQFLLILMLVLVPACSETEQWATWLDDYLTEDAGALGDLDDDIDEWGPLSPEDCLPDEVYDVDEQQCIIDPDDEQVGEGADQGDDDWTDPPILDDDDFTVDVLVIYSVQGNLITDPQLAPVRDELRVHQDDAERHHEIWDLFVLLIPVENRDFVSGFVIYTDGPEETLAAVDPNPQDPTQWILNVDIIDADNTQELISSLIHEFGHLLTLNATQVPPEVELFQEGDTWELYEQAEAACPTYFTGEGCSRQTSFINAFFGRFWAELYAEWYDIDTEPDAYEYSARLEAFYLIYEDRFVSEYAATNPAEDIAESWMIFILEARPDGDTISEQKILFFYEYPDLVELRARILEGIR